MTTLRDRCEKLGKSLFINPYNEKRTEKLESFALEIERETIDRCVLVIGCECEYCCCCLMKKEILALKTEGGKDAGALAAMRFTKEQIDKVLNADEIKHQKMPVLLERITDLENALKDIEALNKNLPQTGLSETVIRNRMEDRAIKALYPTAQQATDSEDKNG